MTRVEMFNSAWFNFRPMVANYIDVHMSDITPTATFQELGVDSLDFVELVMMVEDEYNVEFEEARLDELKTVAGLHTLLIQTIEAKRVMSITHRDTINERCSHCGRQQ